MSLNMNYSIEIGGQTMGFSVGTIARQSTGSVVVQYGKTTVIATACVASEKEGEEKDFFPLLVNVVEKFYASGKIPGSFLRRERQGEREVLESRVIDRPLRPLFPEGFVRDVQVTLTVVSFDASGDILMAAAAGASVACGLAGLPMSDLVAGIRIGLIGDEFVVNPDLSKENLLDMFVASSKSSIFMVESEASELAEEVMEQALQFAHDSAVPLIELMEKIVAAHGKKKVEFVMPDNSALFGKIVSDYEGAIIEAYATSGKQDRNAALVKMRKEIVAKVVEVEGESKSLVSKVLHDVEKHLVRQRALEGKRIDGRGLQDIRTLDLRTSVLPDTCHGSALFTRGETQALVVTTLGSSADEQIYDDITGKRMEHFMLHYNFPPYAVGEVEPLRGPSRREQGHGNLAYKAIKRVMPSKDDFPYTVRVVSEIMESDGSSSMATVCGSSLSLMSTGVPMKEMVAGIAMGLIKEGDKFCVLTDIMADEDHLGDMDFKVARTSKGITALQMDIKTGGISMEIMSQALDHAHKACDTLLEKMSTAFSGAPKLGEHIPRIEEMTIPVGKIAELIGKSGATIKHICEVTGAKIDISQEGIVKIYASGADKIEGVKAMVTSVVSDLVIGEIYEGSIEQVLSFGAIVVFPGNKKGMIHISEIADVRIDDVSQYLHVGQKVSVKFIGTDAQRRLKFSLKQADPGYVPTEEESAGGGNRGKFVSNSGSSSRKSHDRGYDRGDRGYSRSEGRGYDDEQRAYRGSGKKPQSSHGHSSLDIAPVEGNYEEKPAGSGGFKESLESFSSFAKSLLGAGSSSSRKEGRRNSKNYEDNHGGDFHGSRKKRRP